jgi:hypothetical protein
MELLERHSALMVAAEPLARDGHGVHAFFITHLKILLEAAAPHLDAEFTAEALLATLAPAHHLRLRERYSLAQMAQRWGELAQSVTRR